MTREEAIKVLETEIACAKRDSCARIECANCDLVMLTEDILTAFDMAISALRSQEWISVKDRLPEAEGHYIVRTGNGSVTTVKFFIEYGRFQRIFTHWMPLPEPPREDVET